MSSRHWVLSLLVLYHLVALGVDAIPDPRQLSVVTGQIRHPSDNAIAQFLTPLFDRAAIVVAKVEALTFAGLQPIRALTRPYINAGLRQNWTMFTEPVLFDQYLRVDFFVQSGPSAVRRRVQQLVLPADREDRLRLLHDFRDKALINLISEQDEARTVQDDPLPPQDGFVPVARYFAGRFRDRELAPGDVLLRTEVWYGAAPIPPPGQSLSDDVRRSRADVLNVYYDGSIPSIQRGSIERSVGAQEQEADIVWTLEQVERR